MKVSVIIPVSRLKKARKTKDSIRIQGYPGLEVIEVEAKGLNPGEARNKGARKAQGEILLFLDDDCEAQKNWLAENLKALVKPDVGAVGGMVKGKSERYFARCLDFTNFTYAQTKKRREMPVCAASLAIKKEVFQKIGGFNGTMRVGEDTDFCLRLKRLGYKTIYEPKIRVLHQHGRETLKDLLVYQYNNGQIKGLIIENRYPDNFWFSFLKKISHPLLYWFFILPFAIFATLVAVLVNLRDCPKVIFYSPGIFLGKLACQLGIFVWILKKPLAVAGISLTTLNLFVTSQCNSRCRHCFYAKNLNQKDDLNFSQIEKLSLSLGKVRILNLSGGEPFLQKDLSEICRLFFDNNKTESVSIPTNGLLPEVIARQTEKILEKAAGKRIIVCLSLDGTEKTHDTLRGMKGNFKRIIKTYEELAKLKKTYPNFSLRIGTVVYKKNYNDLFKLFSQVPQLFPEIDAITLSLGRSSVADSEFNLPTPSQLKKIFLYKQRTADGKQPFWRKLVERMVFVASLEGLMKKKIIHCSAGKKLEVIFANGDLGLCEILRPVGNIKKESFADIWKSERAKNQRKMIKNNLCFCTHEGFLFYSLLANPFSWPRLLLKSLILK